MIKRIPSVLTVIFLLLSMTACGFFGGTPDVTDATTVDTTAAEEPVPFPVTVNGLTVDASPQTVISLSPSITEILCEMGYEKRLIGKSNYCNYPESIKALQSFGSGASPDIQAIIDKNPDIVISATTIATKDVMRMKQAGIMTLIIPAPISLDTFKGVYKAIGLVFEGLFEGADYGEEKFTPISKACDNVNVINAGNFVYITENFDIATGDTLESAVLSCFGTNIAKDGTAYGFEKTYLTEFKPDFIFVSDKYTIEELEADEVYGALDAVKNGNVLFLDNTFFERPSARITKLIGEIERRFITY